jgi:hypothetical protein
MTPTKSKTFIYAFALGGIAAALRLLLIAVLGQRAEDSLILLRVVRNLLTGNGPVFNLGERFQAATSPLWMLLVSTMGVFSGNVETGYWISIVIGALLASIGVGLTYSSLVMSGVSVIPATIAAILVAAHPDLAMMSSAGLETALLFFFQPLIVWLALRGYWSRCGVCCGLLIWTRLDAGLFVLVILVAVYLTRRAQAIRVAAITAAVISPWLIFAYAYYGSVLPQTMIGKSMVFSGGATIAQRFAMLVRPLGVHGSTFEKLALVIIVAAGVIVAGRRTPVVRWLGVYCALYLGAFFATGTRLMFPWYFGPVLAAWVPLVALLIVYGVSLVPYKRLRIAMAVLCIVGIAAVYARWSINGYSLVARGQQYEDQIRKAVGEMIASRAAPNDAVLLEPAGYIGYYAGKYVRVIDTAGITSDVTLRARQQYGEDWWWEVVRQELPRFIVLRETEWGFNEKLLFGGMLFQSDEDRQKFKRIYKLEVFRGRGLGRTLLLFERREVPKAL